MYLKQNFIYQWYTELRSLNPNIEWMSPNSGYEYYLVLATEHVKLAEGSGREQEHFKEKFVEHSVRKQNTLNLLNECQRNRSTLRSKGTR